MVGFFALLLPLLAAAEPPKVLYHVGQKALLQKDEGNVPKEDWDRFIMGESRSKLAPFRRGLYGGTDFGPIDSYAHKFSGGGAPWVMTIQLKEECRKAAAFSDLKTDPKYQNWLASHAEEIFRSAADCLNVDATNCFDFLATGSLIGGGEGSSCEQVMEKFLRQEKIRVVQDAIPQAWYIRDRDCIEIIQTSAEQVLRVLAEAEWTMESRLKSNQCALGKVPCGSPTLMMLAGALEEAKEIDGATLTKLRTKAANSDITFSPKGTTKISRFAAPMIEARVRCANKRDEFRKVTQELLERYQKTNFRQEGTAHSVFSWAADKFEKICR